MPQIEIKDKKNSVVRSLSVSDECFGLKGRGSLMHEAVKNHLANQRQGTAQTKTRGMVSGGGKKPWRQKHTGRARAGSSRSPLWKGGAVIFGPMPRDYSYDMPKKAKKAALSAALSAKLRDGEIVFVDAISIAKPRTKDMMEAIKGLDLAGKSLLIVIGAPDKNVYLSARNIPAVSVKLASDINAYDVLKHERLVIAEDAVKTLEGRAA